RPEPVLHLHCHGARRAERDAVSRGVSDVDHLFDDALARVRRRRRRGALHRHELLRTDGGGDALARTKGFRADAPELEAAGRAEEMVAARLARRGPQPRFALRLGYPIARLARRGPQPRSALRLGYPIARLARRGPQPRSALRLARRHLAHDDAVDEVRLAEEVGDE